MAAPVGAATPDQRPEEAIPVAEPRAPLGAQRDGQLLPEEQVLQREVALTAEEGAQHADSEAQPLEHGRRMPDGASVTLSDALLAPHRFAQRSSVGWWGTGARASRQHWRSTGLSLTNCSVAS
jgi:hypothetical protein